MAAFVAGVNAGGDSSTATTAGIDTTGAHLIVAEVVYYGAGGGVTFSDSKGNTWVPRTVRNGVGGLSTQLFDCYNPTVGSGHTFTASNNFPNVAVLAFSGADASPFDGENGAGGSAGTIQPGGVTPSTADNIVVCGVGAGQTSGAVAIDSGFTEPNAEVVGAAFQASIAYLIQTAATAQNPTWTIPSGGYGNASGIAVYKATGGGGGTDDIAGTAAVTITAAGTLTGSGALAGTCSLGFGGTGTLTGAGSVAGTCAVTFAGTNTLTGAGALAGTAAVTITPTATPRGAGSLAGSAAMVFGGSATADLPSGSVAGTCAITFGGSGAIAGAGALVGVSVLSTAATGTARGSGSLAGACALAFGGTGVLTDGVPISATEPGGVFRRADTGVAFRRADVGRVFRRAL